MTTRWKSFIFVLPLLAVLLIPNGCGSASAEAIISNSTPQISTSQSSVYFSPNGECESAIVSAIAGATVSVHVLAYELTSNTIAHALAAKRAQGVPVIIVMDAGNIPANYSMASPLKAASVSVYADGAETIMHDKVLIVDGITVLTGSYNYTWSAEYGNAENLVAFRNDPDKGQLFEQEFAKHLSHSVPF